MISTPNADALRTLAQMMADGEVRPIVESALCVAAGAGAVDLVGVGRSAGTVAVRV